MDYGTEKNAAVRFGTIRYGSVLNSEPPTIKKSLMFSKSLPEESTVFYFPIQNQILFLDFGLDATLIDFGRG